MTSTAEILLSEQLRQAGIPFEAEFAFAKPRRFRADFLIDVYSKRPKHTYGPAQLLVEIDGGTWVSGRHNRGSSIAKDFEKGAAAAIAGYRVIHVTTEQVEDGTCLGWIRAALGLQEAA